MRSPCHSTRSCSSASSAPAAPPAAAESAQEAGAVGVQAHVAQRRGSGRQAGRRRRLPSRHQGIGARLKYSARPCASSTTLTTFGLANSATSSMRVRRGGHHAVGGCGAATAAQASISSGSISGSSPCTLTTMSSPSRPSSSQASARRSLPLGWSARVSTLHAVAGAGGHDATRVVGGHHHRVARLRARCGHAHHHRQAGDVGQRLVGQAGEASRAGIRTVNFTGGLQTAAPGRVPVLQASLSSITGMPSRMGKPAGRPGRPVHAGDWRVAQHGSGPLQTGHTSRSIRRWSSELMACLEGGGGSSRCASRR
jgi:hypothetical protein